MIIDTKHSTARYRGEKTPRGVRVWADDRPLRFPGTGVSFRPCEFDWSHTGAGAGALAYTILAHHLEDPSRALHLHNAFMHDVVAKLLRDSQWCLDVEDIEDWLRRAEAARALNDSRGTS